MCQMRTKTPVSIRNILIHGLQERALNMGYAQASMYSAMSEHQIKRVRDMPKCLVIYAT